MDNQKQNRWKTGGLIVMALILSATPVFADDPLEVTSISGADNDFALLSLEQLMSVEVTSVSGIAEPWFTTPAAMYVITAEDVRRSGHQSLAEALRLAPGMSVRRINANIWDVSARGFGSRFNNKLLVLIDGRTVYDPLFSGTYWSDQDVMMEDLDRIEVIRGPGATLWGANAVNGVINVTTKHARDTQGLYISGVTGTDLRALGAARYGTQLDESTWMRVWTQYSNYDRSAQPGPGDAHDDWDMVRGGVRIDRDIDSQTTLSLQAGIYSSDRLGEAISVPTSPGPGTITAIGDGKAASIHVMARLARDIDAANGWSIQSYIEYLDRTQPNGFGNDRTTFDLDYRHRFEIGDKHDIIWGAGARQHFDRTDGTVEVAFDPGKRAYTTVSGFVQDTITLKEDELFAMIGTKLEYNTFTDFEVQPSARLSWTPDENHTLWSAVSRTVRVPSRVDKNLKLTIMNIGVTPVQILGDSDVDSEEMVAYELGYRVRPAENVTLDFSGYFNDYRKLLELTPTGAGTYANRASGESYGFEAAASWRAADNLRVESSYSFQRTQLHGPASPQDETTYPRNQFQVRSMLDITKDLECNAALYYGDTVGARGEAFWRLDLGVTWRPTANLEFAVWGQNLLEASHQESSDNIFQASAVEVQRGVYAQATLRF